jgi:tRNA-dihydrouridine synthase 2
MAPMVRVGTLPMRLLALEFGADLVYTEELIDYKLMKCKKVFNKVLNTVDFVDESEGDNVVFRTCEKEKEKVILQIGTADAVRALKAAKLVEDHVSGIDVNMGCPKEFSVKGGMGAALAANMDNAKNILTTLVNGLSIPVSCKIRIRKTVEETIQHVKELESTGIKAIGIHGRSRDERPQNKPHPEVIKAVIESDVKIPVICNGGSKDFIEKYGDINQFKELCGASSIMIARAAEWNVSIFRKEGMLPIMDVIKMYLKLAVDYDSVATNTKYCVQNMLRELQDSEMGKKFLEAQLMEQICDVFDMKDYCKQKQLEYQKKEMEIRLEKKKLEENGDEPSSKKLKLDDENTITENIAFVRANYLKDVDLPKSLLHLFLKRKLRIFPKYTTEQKGCLFRSTLMIGDKKYSSTFWEKNKKFAEQGASLVACLHYNLVTKEELIQNGSMNMFEL